MKKQKTILGILAAVSVLLLLASVVLPQNILTKRLIGNEDLSLWGGGSDPKTFSYKTSDGHTLTLNKFGTGTYNFDGPVAIGTATHVTTGTALLSALADSSVTAIYADCLLTGLSGPVNINKSFDAGSYQVFPVSCTPSFSTGSTDAIKAAWFDQMTYGTDSSSGQQSANTNAIQRAVTAGAASGIPVGIPSAIVLINDTVTSNAPVAIYGMGSGPARMLQTGASKYVFRLGTSSYTFGYSLKNMVLASAASSSGNVYLDHIIQGAFENIIMPGSGLYGWVIDGCQELHFRNCPNNGYYPIIPGQNASLPNGQWGNGSTTGAGMYITNGTTTIDLDGCDFSICTSGIINDAPNLSLHWYGTAQGLVGLAIDDRGALRGFSIDAYLDGFSSTPGGIVLTGATHGKIHLRNTDYNGIHLMGCTAIQLSGAINSINIDSNCSGITAQDVTYDLVTGGGFIKDQAPDSQFINVRDGGQAGVYYGRTAIDGLVNIYPNSNFERWVGTLYPPGMTIYGGASVAKAGTGMPDTTASHSGDFCARVTGNASGVSGLSFALTPFNLFQGKPVTLSFWHNSNEDIEVYWYGNGGGYVKSTTISNHATGMWVKAQTSFMPPASVTALTVIIDPGNNKTAYIDDLMVETHPYKEGVSTIPAGDATPSLTGAGGGFVPVTNWICANSSPTTITYLGGMYPGLIYTIWLDANTTLQNNGNMHLRGAANKSGANMFIQLMYNSETDGIYQVGYESVN